MNNALKLPVNIAYRILLTCLFPLALNSIADPALQNPAARQSISLNGQWHTIVDPYENGFYNHRYEESKSGYFRNAHQQRPSDLVEYNFSTAPTLQVPGDWNSQRPELFLYEGTVWYQKDFQLNKQRDMRYLLHFGAANYQARVYVNGTQAGMHEGGFTPFQFDVTDLLHNGDNFVVVKVDNRRERNQIPTVNTDWWNYGGITRPVTLLAVPTIHVQDYHLGLSNGKTDEIAVRVSLNKPAVLSEGQLTIAELGIRESFTFNSHGVAELTIKARPQLWSPETPRLYPVSITVNGEQLNDNIGFRDIRVQGKDIVLNGEPVFLRGISIHEEKPLGDGRAWNREEATTLLTWAKELGCNFVRLAHYPHNEAMLKLADEMGLMVWSEIPVYWTVLFDDESVYQKAEQQLREMITRDHNRAAIVLWSMANETPQTQARQTFIARLATTARQLDNSRLITAALDTQASTKTGKLIEDPLAKEVDVIGINSYCGWYSGTPASCAKLEWQSRYHKPVIMSEFGAGALQGLHGGSSERWTEEYQAEVYRENIRMLKNFDALRGVTPWILKDFRSPRRPLTGIQDFWNRKGLISEAGIRKQAWYVLQEYYNDLQKAQNNGTREGNQ